MKLCAAQLASEIGSIDKNVHKHLALIDAAIARSADLIVFPELSLTGYEPKLADAMASDLCDPRLDVFQERADAAQITIGVGLPTRSPQGVQISIIVFRPRASRLAYAKQQLHADELPYFVAGREQLILSLSGHRCAPAICYESLQASHAEVAAANGADIYLASVAKPQRNVLKAYEHYPQVAQRLGMSVLMANAIGTCDGFVSAGQSTIWNRSGERIAQLGTDEEGLVMFDTSDRHGSVFNL